MRIAVSCGDQSPDRDQEALGEAMKSCFTHVDVTALEEIVLHTIEEVHIAFTKGERRRNRDVQAFPRKASYTSHYDELVCNAISGWHHGPSHHGCGTRQ